jgi:hypothetical protein
LVLSLVKSDLTPFTDFFLFRQVTKMAKTSAYAQAQKTIQSCTKLLNDTNRQLKELEQGGKKQQKSNLIPRRNQKNKNKSETIQKTKRIQKVGLFQKHFQILTNF